MVAAVAGWKVSAAAFMHQLEVAGTGTLGMGQQYRWVGDRAGWRHHGTYCTCQGCGRMRLRFKTFVTCGSASANTDGRDLGAISIQFYMKEVYK